MKKKNRIFLWVALLGLAIMQIVFLLQDQLPRPAMGLALGIGSGMVGVGGAKWYMKRLEEKEPALLRQSTIETNDERNIAIRNRSKAMAGDILQWYVMGVAYLTLVVRAPLWVTLASIGVFLLYTILSLCFMAKFQNEM